MTDTEELSNIFKEMVIKWVNADDKIRTISNEIKELKNEKKQYETYILDFMNKMEENTIKLSNGLLKKHKSQTKGSLKEEYIQEAIKELTKDSEKAYQMTQYIIQKRPVCEKINLKRTINHKK